MTPPPAALAPSVALERIENELRGPKLLFDSDRRRLADDLATLRAGLAQQGEVDLEQFRKPVTAWRALAEIGVLVEYMPYHFRKPEDEYSRRVKEADRLLAIIDAKGPRRPALGEGWEGLAPAALQPAASEGEKA